MALDARQSLVHLPAIVLLELRRRDRIATCAIFGCLPVLPKVTSGAKISHGSTMIAMLPDRSVDERLEILDLSHAIAHIPVVVTTYIL